MEHNEVPLYSARDLTGKKLGTCLLEQMIGRGGMGEVYLAHQERPERRVAVKTLRAHRSMDSETIQQFRARFQREANLIACLDHVNIMPIYEYGEQAGIGYLVMPYLTGGSLRDLLQRQGALSQSQVLTYLEQAAKALDYAHEQGIIHRDLKPANFLLHADGRLVLADFGIARIVTNDNQSDAGAPLTGTGVLLGTPEYMAPEMIRGEELNRRTDIYELGIVLYQMLSGSVPFKGNTPLIVAAMQLQQSLPLLHSSNSAIPLTVDAVLQVATAKVAAERFPTAGAMAQAFRDAIVPSDMSPSPTAMNAPTLSSQRNLPHTVLTFTQEIPSSIGVPSGASKLLPLQPVPIDTSPETPISSQPGITPPPTPYPSLQISSGRSRRQSWPMLLGILMIAVLVVGGILIDLQLRYANSNFAPNQQPVSDVAQTTTGATPKTTATTPMPSPTAPPVQRVPKGPILYATSAPGASNTNASCDGGNEQWVDYNSSAITCQPGHVILHNPQQALAGIILAILPNNASYPSNYVVEAQIQEDTSSQADFGLYFRNQAGNAQGIYTFLIHPDGSWASYVYDNNTGTPTQISSGSAGVYAYARLILDVVVNGSNYTFYINGQRVGQAHDTTYPSGTAGVVIDAGGTLDISSFALYALS